MPGIIHIPQVTPANLFLFELYHESGILHFEEDHPGSPKPLSGKSKSLGFLRKSIFSTFFLVFWGPKALYFDPNTLVGLRNPTFGGVKLLKLFDLSNGLEVENAKIGPFFGKISHENLKTYCSDQKVSEV